MTLRDEIFDIICSNMNCYEDSHAMQPNTEDKIIKAIERRITEIPLQLTITGEYAIKKDDLKELLK